MKIGIVTYWKSTDNYGEQLQNYALQEYLRGLGHEPFLIRYDYEADTIYGTKPLPVRLLRACNPRRLAGYFKSRKNNRMYKKNCLEHPRGFEEFRKAHLTMSRVYSSIYDIRNDPPEADMYIAGSDQVWNTFGGKFSEMRNRLSAFFLDFGKDDVKRISYAASWGRTIVSDEESELIRPLLARFDAVSVREASGIDVCGRLGREDAFLAPDPVLLHDAETYRKLYRSEITNKPDGQYLLFYYLNPDGSFDRRAVFDWASARKLKVIYVTNDWHDDLERSFPGVTEWLELIDNAEYVVTNSFHCSLIALLFGKRFGVIRRIGSFKGMNTRMDTLFETCGIEPRYIDGTDFEVLVRPADKIRKAGPDEAMTPEKIIELVTGRT